MTLKVTDLLNQSDVVSFIAQIGERATTLTSDIHLAACSTFQHAMKYGDWTGITRLLDSLPKSQRVKALAFWYTTFSNGRISLSVDPETKLYRVNKDKFAGRSDADFRLDEALETTYADLTAEKDPTTLGLEKYIKSMERTATNAGNFEGTSIPKVSPAVRELASQLVIVAKAFRAAKEAAATAEAAEAAKKQIAVAV
jgi:hypothetical protein